MADATGKADKDKFSDGADLTDNQENPKNEAMEALNAQWHKVRSRLRAELGEATFNSWFRLLWLHGKGVI